MTCPQCQKGNEPGAVFCNQCAALLVQPERHQHRGLETSFIVFWVATLIMIIGIAVMVSKDLPLKWRQPPSPPAQPSPDQ